MYIWVQVKMTPQEYFDHRILQLSLKLSRVIVEAMKQPHYFNKYPALLSYEKLRGMQLI